MTDVIVPADLWEEDVEGALSVWFVETGDVVARGDVLCELMAEKVTFEVTATADGEITLLVEPETAVQRGGVIARIGCQGSRHG